AERVVQGGLVDAAVEDGLRVQPGDDAAQVDAVVVRGYGQVVDEARAQHDAEGRGLRRFRFQLQVARVDDVAPLPVGRRVRRVDRGAVGRGVFGLVGTVLDGVVVAGVVDPEAAHAVGRVQLADVGCPDRLAPGAAQGDVVDRRPLQADLAG